MERSQDASKNILSVGRLYNNQEKGGGVGDFSPGEEHSLGIRRLLRYTYFGSACTCVCLNCWLCFSSPVDGANQRARLPISTTRRLFVECPLCTVSMTPPRSPSRRRHMTRGNPSRRQTITNTSRLREIDD